MARKFWIQRLTNGVLALMLALSSISALLPAQPVAAAGELTVEVIAGYNLVVDSNVSSPSTYAPRVATVIGKFCNTGADELTNVYGYIGDFKSGVNSTPGVYPARDSASDPEFQSGQKWNYLYNTGSYFFRHVGATSDATRYIGALSPGECRYQYWTVEYPACENVGGVWSEPPCTGDPTWGTSVKPDDDLSLAFDIWGQGYDASASTTRTDSTRWAMTMRNEISAMANKIEPNGSLAGRWFNTDEATIRVGDVITTNGVLYSLGNIRSGFDNDGDYAPDYNAWLQPISQPTYDPNCFRLIRTSGLLTVTLGSGQPQLIMPFENNLYFTNLPPNNTNVRGEVYYTFLALNGPCTVNLSPYQEVASGFDNEKFNGDYGTGAPPVISVEPEVTIDKSSSPNTMGVGSTTTYHIPFANSGAADAGLSLSSGYGIAMPLTIVDTVPDGMQLAAAATASLNYVPNTGVTIRYSTDSGATWSATAPTGTTSTWPDAKIMIQWQLNDPLPAGSTGNYAEFEATVPSAYAGSVLIENTACVGLGDAEPFGCATDVLKVTGNNSLNGTVFEDNGSGNDFANEEFDSGEATISGINISLYINVNGEYQLWDTTTSNASGNYSFSNLPDGEYRIDVGSVQATNPGWTNTTEDRLTVDLDKTHLTTDPVVSNDNDFGFAPALTLEKSLVGPDPALEDQLVTFAIDLNNILPGDGTAARGICHYTYDTWANQSTGGTFINSWESASNSFEAIEPGSLASYSSIGGNTDSIVANAFTPNVDTTAPTISKVEAVFYIYVDTTAGQLGTSGNTSADDQIRFQVLDSSNSVVIDHLAANTNLNTNYSGTSISNQKIYTVEVTSLVTNWALSDFTNYKLAANTQKKGASDKAVLYINSLGWRVTIDQSCGGDAPNTTIDPLPLTDTYDATKLEFISANPAESNVAVDGSNGAITWDNLGPLYPGGEKTVNVTFRVKDGTFGQTLVNTASVDNAYFTNGNPTNDATDNASVSVVRTARLGDRVWNDVDGDGVQDAGEVGIPGATVTLTPETNVVINGVTYGPSKPWVTTTDSNGGYLFIGLPDANYAVTIDPTSLPGTTYTQTFDRDGTLNHTTIVPIVSGGDVLDADFGYQIPNTIYGTVWEDFDGDSNREVGDDPITGVTVWLYDSSNALVGITTTDANGAYVFSDLANGNYYIVVDNASTPLGADWTNTRDPETAPGNHQSDIIPVSGGNLYGSYDFGYHQTGSYSISGKVYPDVNSNEDWDTTESGFGDIPVTLYSATGAIIATTLTDADGNYSFGNLPNGDYTVVVDRTALPGSTLQTEDPDTTRDGRTTVTINNAPITEVDFGYKFNGNGSIGDTVYRDLDGDGTQQVNETGIANITVWLEMDFDNDGTYTRVATTITDADGKYLFSSLPDGKYRVLVDSSDSDLPKDPYNNAYTPSTSTTTGQITISSGSTYLDADFGFKPLGAIGDRVWQDNNANGNQDEGEPGINDVTVGLYTWTDVDGDGIYSAITDTLSITPLATRITSGDGNYLFTGLPAGKYVAQVISGIPAGFVQSGDPDWLEPCTGTDLCDGASGVNLRTGQLDMSRDFGYRPGGVIGDFIWFDADGDGVQDEGEGGIGYVTVQLCEDSKCNLVLATTQTDSDGYYSFGNRSDGTYYVEVITTTLPADVTATYDLDSGTTSPDGITAVTLSGNSNLTADFGYRYAGAYDISGTVFFDTGNDGGLYSDGTDNPYAGITVYLWRDGAIIGTTTTDANGYYIFPDLPNGDYVVSVDRSAPSLTGMTLNTPVPTPYYRPVTIADADEVQEDFGFYAAIDYGDLPDTYGTTVANNGAGHIVGGLSLGTVVASTDGNPSAEANGDDLIDDGGITFGSESWEPGNTVSLNANVSGANGYLVGWFDWNADGKFDASEMEIFGNVVDGANSLSLKVPADASNGSSYIYMRFRLYDKNTLIALSPTGLATNGEVEDYQHSWAPTAVELLRFEAAAQGEAVLLTWETATELDNLGFNLYRSASPAGPWVLVNPALIPAQAPGAVFGAVYELLDTEVTPGAPSYYRLEDVDIHGASTFHGPISITLAGPSAVSLVSFGATSAPFGLLPALLTLGALGLAHKRRK